MEQYYMFEEVLENGETGALYCCYGVGIGEERYADLCLEKAPVQEFVQRLNEEELEQIHLRGAIEDFVQSLDAKKIGNYETPSKRQAKIPRKRF